MIRILVVLLLLMPALAHAGVRRFAVIVGANDGDESEVRLRFAESDAERIAKILADLGGFAREDVLLLSGADAEDMRRSLIGANVRIREAGGEALLFVFYSGHADANALHLSGTRLPMSEVRDLIYGSPAGARLLVIDACRSGAVTRIKGGKPAPAFAIDFDAELAAKGVAILTSSAAGEDSQESDQLGASFFTHYLASALVGAADGDSDGRVTLAEAFGYASERTLVATAATLAGPQHPTYRFELGGREDLVLTMPGAKSDRMGALEVGGKGTWLVQRSGGSMVAEIAVPDDSSRLLALAPGSYLVTRRGRDHLMQAEIAVERGETERLTPGTMKRVAYARVVRKGSSDAVRLASVSTFAAAGARSEITDTGTSTRTDAGVRVDFRPVSFEVRFGIGRSLAEIQTPDPDRPRVISTSEVSLSVSALRAFDIGRVTLSGGVEIGRTQLRMDIPKQLEFQRPDQVEDGFTIGPLGTVELDVWRGIHVRADGAVLTYSAHPSVHPKNSTGSDVWTWRASAGLGVHF